MTQNVNMKKGEKAIIGGLLVLVTGSIVYNVIRGGVEVKDEGARDIPYYSDAPMEVQRAASQLMKELNCRQCHSIWTMRDPLQSVPAPALDGLGSLYDEKWFYDYLSSANPQAVVPTRLKKEYQMPSYASLPEEQRRLIAQYLASLKVKDWYLEETRKREFEKLTGRDYTPGG